MWKEVSGKLRRKEADRQQQPSKGVKPKTKEKTTTKKKKTKKEKEKKKRKNKEIDKDSSSASSTKRISSTLNLNNRSLDATQLSHFLQKELFPTASSMHSQLTSLTLANNQLDSLPEEFLLLCKLQTLDLRSNRLARFPEEVLLQMTSIRSLNLSHNAIRELPKEIWRMSSLEVLRVADNQLSHLPKELAEVGKKKREREAEGEGEGEKKLARTGLKLVNVSQNYIDLAEVPMQILQLLSCYNDQHVPQLIVPGLYLGSMASASNLAELQQRNITHILVVGRDLTSYFPDQFVYMEVAVDDTVVDDLFSHFDSMNSFIHDAILRSGVILVHCAAGVSRSATATIAYLMAKQGMSFRSAFDLVKSKRYCIDPNEGFLSQLQRYERVVGKAGKEDEGEAKEQWQCSECTLLNSFSSFKCIVCDALRP